jgi:putative ABC transport system substrate-binding protein
MAKKSRKKKTVAKRKKKSLAATRTIGVLHTGSEGVFKDLVKAMRDAAEYPQNTVVIKKDDQVDGHYADDDIGKLEDDADELVNDASVEVIVAAGGPQSAIAAMDAADEAGSKKRIVFTTVVDPVGLGLVDDLEFPGRNLTGTAGKTSETDPDRLTLLYRYISPGAINVTYGVLINPSRQQNRKQYKPLVARAKKLKIKLVRARATSVKGIKRAFKALKKKGVKGVVVTADSFFNNNRGDVIDAAAIAGLPAIYQWRQFVEKGGLISYGPKIEDAYITAGQYVKAILKGGDPADMACSIPDSGSFELVINTVTAAALGRPVPGAIDGKPVEQYPPPPSA